MLKQALAIESIPALIWGAASDKAYIFVHGQKSKKEEAEGFAGIAEKKGYQVVSFDLPEHGERKAEATKCTVQNGVYDLRLIGDFVIGRWKTIALFCNSLGAYFSLVAYPDLKFTKCLFLSPILDMERLIQNMLTWFNVSEAALEEKQEISTPTGETLSWSYYTYVKSHPVTQWQNPTAILYGSHDNLTEGCVVEAFAKRFQCELEILQGGEHYFHTPEQLAVADKWLEANI